MTTIYDLLEVNENASKKEIEEAYNKIILEFRIDPKLDSNVNKDNELILNKIKIAYEILMDDAKRARYDKELANKRAEDLLKNVKVVEHTDSEDIVKKESSEHQDNNFEDNKKIENNSVNQNSQNNVNNNQVKQVSNTLNNQNVNNKSINNQNITNDKTTSKQNDKLTRKEINEIRKNAKNDFNQKLKKAQQINKAQQAQNEYNNAYEQAYNAYLKRMGYNVKEKWTLKRVKNIFITIIAILLTALILWLIPPFRNMLIKIYEENYIIHALVNIIISIFNAIFSIFKK